MGDMEYWESCLIAFGVTYAACMIIYAFAKWQFPESIKKWKKQICWGLLILNVLLIFVYIAPNDAIRFPLQGAQFGMGLWFLTVLVIEMYLFFKYDLGRQQNRENNLGQETVPETNGSQDQEGISSIFRPEINSIPPPPPPNYSQVMVGDGRTMQDRMRALEEMGDASPPPGYQHSASAPQITINHT